MVQWLSRRASVCVQARVYVCVCVCEIEGKKIDFVIHIMEKRSVRRERERIDERKQPFILFLNNNCNTHTHRYISRYLRVCVRV